MRWGVIASVAALSLAACGDTPAADGYVFGSPEFDRDQITVTVVQYDTQKDFSAAANARGVASKELEAFAVLAKSEPKCEIHILRVATNYRPQWLGHEMAHCMHGRWHP